MLRETAYSRQLDHLLEQVGNDLSALDAINESLAKMPDYEPSQDDNEELENWLDRLDAEREYPPQTSPLWKAWLARTPLWEDA